ncbi:MAG TPA: PAAR domain-containing protein [Polyangia bacterium]|nr:PAAR domain-containing protein [Polyangia bacterium]
MGGQPAAPIGSRTQRKGIVGVEKDTVLVENRPISYVTAPHSCRVHGRTKIGKGCQKVLVYGKPMARMTDKATCGCKIVNQVAKTVLVGEENQLFGNLMSDLSDWWEGVAHYGKGIRIVGSKEFIAHTTSELDQLKKIPTGRKILEAIDDPNLRKDGRITLLEETKGCDSAQAVPVKVTDLEGTKKAIKGLSKEEAKAADDQLDAQAFPTEVKPSPDVPDRLIVTKPGTGVPADHLLVGVSPRCRLACMPDGGGAVTHLPRPLYLGHELLHVIHFMKGTSLPYDDPKEMGSNLEEAQTMGTGAYKGTPMTENAMRDEIGVINRAGHAGMCPVGSKTYLFRPPNVLTPVDPPK